MLAISLTSYAVNLAFTSTMSFDLVLADNEKLFCTLFRTIA